MINACSRAAPNPGECESLAEFPSAWHPIVEPFSNAETFHKILRNRFSTRKVPNRLPNLGGSDIQALASLNNAHHPFILLPLLPLPLARPQALPVRSHLLPLHAYANREIHLQCVPFSLFPLSPSPSPFFTLNFLLANCAPADGFRQIKNNTDSFLFLFLSMIVIAASLYLPEHISFIARRAWFYWGGEEVAQGLVGGAGAGTGARVTGGKMGGDIGGGGGMETREL